MIELSNLWFNLRLDRPGNRGFGWVFWKRRSRRWPKHRESTACALLSDHPWQRRSGRWQSGSKKSLFLVQNSVSCSRSGKCFHNWSNLEDFNPRLQWFAMVNATPAKSKSFQCTISLGDQLFTTQEASSDYPFSGQFSILWRESVIFSITNISQVLDVKVMCCSPFSPDSKFGHLDFVDG